MDDITVECPAIRKGWSYDPESDTMKYDGEKTCQLENDARTLGILGEIASSIDPNLKFTVDFPTANQDGRLPILDLKVWMDGKTLRHSFYRKECATDLTILWRSALPAATKRSTVFAEGVRRMQAMDRTTWEQEGARVLGEYLNTLRKSGYDHAYRLDVLQGLLEWRRTNEEDIQQGRKTRYRSGEQIREMKAEDRLGHSNTWFLRGEITSTLSVQATTGGELAANVQAKIRDMRAPDGGLVKVTEKAGKSHLSGLLSPDPMMAKGCKWLQSCLVDEKGSCWTSRVTYTIKCLLCGWEYLGTTGHTIHHRGQQHLEALRGGNTSYGITKHFMQKHPDWDGVVQPFTISARGKGGIQSNLERYVTEAVAIETRKREGASLMNSRGEWGLAKLTRLGITSNLA